MIKLCNLRQVILVISLITVLLFIGCNNSNITDSGAPAEVTSLSVTAGNGQVILTWTDPSDADFDHVNIYYGTGGTAETAFSGTINPAGTIIKGLTNGTVYTFMIQTEDSNGNVSKGVSTTSTPDGTAPVEVNGLSISAGNGQITLKWTDPTDSDFDHVNIYYGTGGTADTVFSGTVNSNGTVIEGLSNGTAYTFKIQTEDTVGNVSDGVTITGTPGPVMYDGGNGDDYGRSVAIDANGNVVTAGVVSNGTDKNMALWRYTPSGTLDTSFGTNGLVIYNNNGDDTGHSIVIDSGGNLIITGELSNGTDKDMALWRYTSTGVLDTSFGTNGIVKYDSGNGDDHGLSVVIDAIGNIIVAGSVKSSTDKDMALWRYTSTGVLETGFGTNGIVKYGNSNGDDYGRSVVIDGSNNFVVTGELTNGPDKDMALWCYNSAGTLDSSFGTGGIVKFDNGRADIGYSLTTDTNSNLIIAGFCLGSDSFDRYLWRYTSSGVLDASFGTGGIVKYSSGNGPDMGYSVVVDGNGKLVVGGYIHSGTDWDMAVLRYTTSGVLDTSFGIDGVVIYNNSNGHDMGVSIAIDANNNSILTGYFNNGSDQDMALWYIR